jgi:hypothetical protein
LDDGITGIGPVLGYHLVQALFLLMPSTLVFTLHKKNGVGGKHQSKYDLGHWRKHKIGNFNTQILAFLDQGSKFAL